MIFHNCGEIRKKWRLALVAWPAMLLGTVIGASALDWQLRDGYRFAPLPVPPTGKTGFTPLNAAALGVLFTNRLSDERSLTNRNLLSGSGVAAGDVDGDGLCDLYFCSLGTGNALFRNLGNWKFEDITEQAGVACRGQDCTGAVFADIDGDGALDLLVNSWGGGTRIFHNSGHGHFTEVTAAAGVTSRTGATSMALADIDGDGDLDLYVTNFRPNTIRDEIATRFGVKVENGRTVVTTVNDRPATLPDLTNRFVMTPSGGILEQSQAPVLYLNDGKGHFTPVSFTDGTFRDEEGQPLREPPLDWGLAAQFHDLNGDGAPDLYVCNDLHSPDRIWINDGHGRFKAIARLAIRSTSVFSMGVDMADIDRDGSVDIFVVDMLSREHEKRMVQVAARAPSAAPIGVYDNRPQINRNTLQVNRGDQTYAELAYYGGVEASEWSWGPVFADIDLDGYEDILVMNGQLRDFQNADLDRRILQLRASQRMSVRETLGLVKLYPRLDARKVIFRNRHDRTFEEMGAAWGLTNVGIAQGMVLADLDNDGDLDLVTNNLNEAPSLYRNDGIAPRIAVRLKGLSPNTKGIGAQIQVLGGPVAQSQEIICGGRYLSGDEPMRVFAAGNANNELTIQVRWRSGKYSTVSHAEPNCAYEIDESSAQPQPGHSQGAALQATAGLLKEWPRPTFEDVSALIKHRHTEQPFDDFERQPLLPNRLSQLGPGISWQDYDGDGWDDLTIATGKGGHLSVYRNNRQGGFEPIVEAPLDRIAQRDQTTVLVPAPHLIVVGSSSYEDGLTNGGAIRIYDLNRHVVGESILGESSSTGPLAMADVDGDGDLDLFIGGRVIPGHYPQPAASLLLANNAGRFSVAQRWDNLGLISGATFSDLDGDGFPELILASEWGPVRVFQNTHGTFTEITGKLGLAQYTGWWNGVATGDFDGDGRMDIVASNWGLNTRYRATSEHPRQLYYGDLDGHGTQGIIEAYDDELMKKIVPDRGFAAVGAALPFLQEIFTTYESYGRASVGEIFGKQLERAGSLQANTLSSMVFLNRGDHFEAVALPPEAQYAPAFGICVGDMDGDGAEDLFLSQNFFATNPDNQRCDAGRGLWLKGDGKGSFIAVPGQQSGVKVYGEQRGCALGDYDQDGRIDLVVTQNGAETRLFHNVGATPGLRVRLLGAPGNSAGIGAALRLQDDLGSGPVREVHAGSGYWSQDSAVQVMTFPRAPKQLWIRWPGGKETTTLIPLGAREIQVNPAGALVPQK